MYQEPFPDCKITKNFKCSRTKTTCILNQVMRPLTRNELTEYMKEEPFSLLNDASSDTGLKRLTQLLLIYFMSIEARKLNASFMVCV